MKKQPLITEQTKANLKAAFWKLYTEKPIEKISIKQITDLAGYNRGTFYLYYEDVYDIFHQIEEELLNQIQNIIETPPFEQRDLRPVQTDGHYRRTGADTLRSRSISAQRTWRSTVHQETERNYLAAVEPLFRALQRPH